MWPSTAGPRGRPRCGCGATTTGCWSRWPTTGGAGRAVTPGGGLAGLVARVDSIGGEMDGRAAPMAVRPWCDWSFRAHCDRRGRRPAARRPHPAAHRQGPRGRCRGVRRASTVRRGFDCPHPDLAVVDIRLPPEVHRRGPGGPRGAIRRRLGRRWGCSSCRSTSSTATSTTCSTRDSAGIGYLLKDRIADVADFLRGRREDVGGGGTVLDSEVVRQLLGRTRRRSSLDELTARERDGAAA